jgi:hypothetical protein
MVGGKENVSKTMTADGGRNALLRRRLMLRDEAAPAAGCCCSRNLRSQSAVGPEHNPPESARSAARQSECAGQLAADRHSSI